MKSVLISIQPKWCELIANGKKLVEVRKTKPKIDVPFKCYIYCTKDNTFAEKTLRGFDDNGKAIYYKANKGKVIGEFVCDNIDAVIWLSNPTRLSWENTYNKDSCLTDNELYNYSNGELFYKWHISDLVIYDKPKELGEFQKHNRKAEDCEYEHLGLIAPRCSECDGCRVTRPFQSWGYVEELGE